MAARTGIHLHFDAGDISRDFRPPGDSGPGYAALDIGSGTRTHAHLFFDSTAAVDAAIHELAALKAEMSGEPQPGPVLPRIDPATLSHMRARLTAAALPEPDWCTAVTELDDSTLYCDREPGHAGSHHAPGPDEGSEVAWSDEAGERDISGLCHFHGGSRGDEAECAMCAAELARIALEGDDDEARQAAEFAADAASLDELEPLHTHAFYGDDSTRCRCGVTLDEWTRPGRAAAAFGAETAHIAIGDEK